VSIPAWCVPCQGTTSSSALAVDRSGPVTATAAAAPASAAPPPVATPAPSSARRESVTVEELVVGGTPRWYGTTPVAGIRRQASVGVAPGRQTAWCPRGPAHVFPQRCAVERAEPVLAGHRLVRQRNELVDELVATVAPRSAPGLKLTLQAPLDVCVTRVRTVGTQTPHRPGHGHAVTTGRLQDVDDGLDDVLALRRATDRRDVHGSARLGAALLHVQDVQHRALGVDGGLWQRTAGDVRARACPRRRSNADRCAGACG